MKRFGMSTALKPKPFLASAACSFILLVFAIISPRGMLAGVTNQSSVLTNQVSGTINGKTTTIDLGACPQSFCELRVGGSARLNPGKFGNSGGGTVGQFSVTLGEGTNTFYFPAGTPNGLQQSDEDSRHGGYNRDGYNHDTYNFVLPPSGPFFTQRGKHIYLRFVSTSTFAGDLEGTTNGTAIFKATTTGKKIVGLQMPGTVGLIGAGMLGLAGIFGVLTLKHFMAG